MTIHEMKLTEKGFEAIKNGSKVYEFRLNDEKRQKIQIGDRILFSKLPELVDKITVEVISIKGFDDFGHMFDYFQKHYPNSTKEDWVGGMYKYYSKEDEQRYGALAIGVKLVG